MSTDASTSQRREQALRMARRRLRWLEIETHRIKAELARLEANFEDDLADRLTRRLRRKRLLENGRRPDEPRVDERHVPFLKPPVIAANAAEPFSEIPAPPNADPATWAPASIEWSGLAVNESPLGVVAERGRSRRRSQHSRPLVASIAIHVLALCIMLPWTIATVAQQQAPLLATIGQRSEDVVVELSEFDAKPADGEPRAAAEPVAFPEPAENLSEKLLGELLPTESVAASIADGVPDRLFTELGDLGNLDLASGAGGAGGKGQGGELGFTTFFGTKSQGDRFVFVVDNSSSMKDGRLELALAELVRSVETLGKRQSFYVIFVADQTYPMYFPDIAPELVAATPENKKRLGDWLGKVRLAGGKNRELIKAVNMAAALRPHAVYLLWDGDLRYSEAVRRDVMSHLAGPQPWNFPIHTLGMGALSVESEQNLAAIAQARGGIYRRIDVPRPPVR
jgi:hypothetical protein